MAWSRTGPAVTLVEGGIEHALATASTCTVVARDPMDGTHRLRMFGIDEGQIRASMGPTPWRGAVLSDDNPSPGSVEQGADALDLDAEPVFNVGYIDSAPGIAAADLVFRIDDDDVDAAPPVHTTCIPAWKHAKDLEVVDWLPFAGGYGVRSRVEARDVAYKDVSIVDLPSGQGRLVLLCRYDTEATTTTYADRFNASRYDTLSAIVAYWAPDEDPTFSGTGVKGPYWLVSRIVPVGGERHPTWLGVRSGAVVTENGVVYLLVYFVCESSWFRFLTCGVDAAADEAAYMVSRERNGFEPGTWVRKIQLTDLQAIVGFPNATPVGLDWATVQHDIRVMQQSQWISNTLGPGAASSYALNAAMSWRSAMDAYDAREAAEAAAIAGVDWTDEGAWDLRHETGLIPGEVLGRVRVWVATGSEFVAGDDPGTDPKGNVEFDQHFYATSMVDPAAVVCADGTLVLYFSSHFLTPDLSRQPEPTAPHGWGIWRAAALPVGTTTAFGRDFAVYRDSHATAVEGERDQVARYMTDDPGEIEEEGGLRVTLADADPVQIPDGTWIANLAGSVDLDVTHMLHRYEGTENDGCAAAGDAWS